MKQTALFLSALLSLSACQTDKNPSPNNDKDSQGSDIRIAWDYSSMQQIAERGGYPRLQRMRDNSLGLRIRNSVET